MNITILGAGRMARGIGTRLAFAGNTIHILARNPTAAAALASALESSGQADISSAALEPGAIHGEVVILAVPYTAIHSLLEQFGKELDGRIIVDISNPVNRETFDGMVTPADSSAAQEIAAHLPEAHVVKAFNTVMSPTLPSGIVAGQSLDVFLAGDDPEAVETISQLVKDGGMRPIPVGPLRRARELEAMGFLHMLAQKTLHENHTALKILT